MKKIIILISFLFFTQSASSADQTIEMLNKLGKEHMVYSKKIVKINIGDTVFWKSTKPGHNVEFIKNGVPEGVGKSRSPLSKFSVASRRSEPVTGIEFFGLLESYCPL